MVPRLKERYEREILPELSKELGVDNVMALPRLEPGRFIRVSFIV